MNAVHERVCYISHQQLLLITVNLEHVHSTDIVLSLRCVLSRNLSLVFLCMSRHKVAHPNKNIVLLIPTNYSEWINSSGCQGRFSLKGHQLEYRPPFDKILSLGPFMTKTIFCDCVTTLLHVITVTYYSCWGSPGRPSGIPEGPWTPP